METTLNYIHGDKYPSALKIASRFVTQVQTRPILQYVKHDENGNMYACDSHRAIKVTSIHGFKETLLIHPKTFMAATGEYPDLDKILGDGQEEEYKKVLSIKQSEIKMWHQLLKSINHTVSKVMKIRNNMVAMERVEDNIQIGPKITAEQSFSIQLPGNFEEAEINFDRVYINSEYLRDALEGFKLMESKNIDVYMKNQMRPIILTDHNQVEIAILPVRVY